MHSYPVPAARVSDEILVKNSRFIADLAPASDINAAEAFIAHIEETYPDATHHVPAYIIGHGSSKITHANDDGEPSGTAGRPALSVLEGSDLGDVVVVVTRYFGGTKLGTGGLVRAYSDAVRSVRALVPKARSVQTHVISLTTPYPLYERITRIVKDSLGFIETEEFTSEVDITVKIPVENYERFQQQILDLSRGTIHPRILENDVSTILPVPSTDSQG